MKKLTIIIAIVLGLEIGAHAQGGLFQYGAVSDEEYYGSATDQVNHRDGLLLPGLPLHGTENHENAPLGGGAIMLIGFGVVYALKKRNKEQNN